MKSKKSFQGDKEEKAASLKTARWKKKKQTKNYQHVCREQSLEETQTC